MRIAAMILIVGCLAACGDSNGENAVDDMPIEGMGGSDDRQKILCDVIHERVTEEECADLRALREDVRTGAAALNVPNPMTRDTAVEVTLIVDRRPLREIQQAEQTSDPDPVPGDDPADGNALDTNAVEVNASVAELPEGNMQDPATGTDPGDPAAETPNQASANMVGEDHAFYSRVGRYMKASLVGEGFDTRLISPSDPLQEIAAGGQGTWIWEVIPRKGGSHTLTALTEAVGKVGDRAVPLGNGRTTKTISVEVRTVDRIWDALIAAPGWLKALAAVIAGITGLLTAWLTLGKAWRNRSAGP